MRGLYKHYDVSPDIAYAGHLCACDAYFEQRADLERHIGKESPGDLWTAEDVELVGEALHEYVDRLDELVDHERGSYRQLAVVVLAALAEAGRLLPADAAEREQWGFRRKEGGMVYQTSKDAAQASVQTMRRQVWVGQWQPVPDEVKR